MLQRGVCCTAGRSYTAKLGSFRLRKSRVSAVSVASLLIRAAMQQQSGRAIPLSKSGNPASWPDASKTLACLRRELKLSSVLMRLGRARILGPAALCICAMAIGSLAHAEPGISTAENNSSSLPSGTSDAFRGRMLDWKAPPALISHTREVLRDVPGGRLFISSPFGWRSDPIQGIHRRHAGIDLPGPPMTSVHSTGAGIVRIAGRAGGYGNLVEIEHPGGVRTRYGHLARVLVSPGESVGQGQTIGRMGSTGRSTGTHLHYEVRVNGVAVDPLDYIGQTIPSYQTAWAAETSVSARWAGWSDTSAGHSLPGAKIR